MLLWGQELPCAMQNAEKYSQTSASGSGISQGSFRYQYDMLHYIMTKCLQCCQMPGERRAVILGWKLILVLEGDLSVTLSRVYISKVIDSLAYCKNKYLWASEKYMIL